MVKKEKPMKVLEALGVGVALLGVVALSLAGTALTVFVIVVVLKWTGVL